MSLNERREIVRMCRESGAVGGVCVSVVRISGSSESITGTRTLVAAAQQPASLSSDGEAEFLTEPLDTPEAEALLLALEATLAGELRVVATVLPKDNILRRIVLDEIGDVIFASDALSTPDVVDVRAAARKAAHGTVVEFMGNRIFVEHLEAMQQLTSESMAVTA